MSLDEFIHALPKVELHVHLEGSIRPSTLLTLAARNGVELPAHNLEEVRRFYCFVDFDHFLKVYLTISNCLRTAADYELIAYEFGADMARQNIRYAEVTFTPDTNVANSGLSFGDILAGLNAGRARAQADFGVEFKWVLDIVRNVPESSQRVVEWAIGARARGVVALGLGGTEQGFPPDLFSDAFARARQAGLHSVPHAGETVGPESVWAALHLLGAERIGHGVRCTEDPALVDHLRQQQIPLEVCPTSNLCLGVYPSYEEHPLWRLWEEGLYVTVNSDDPPMFNTDLVQEYQHLAHDMGFTAAELEALSLNALRASFLPPERKAALEAELRSEFQRLRKRYLPPG